MTLDRVRDLLGELGPPVTALELAEMLWLASHLPADDHAAEPEPEPELEPRDTDAPEDEQASFMPEPAQAARPRTSGGNAGRDRRPLYVPMAAPGSDASLDADALLVPTAPMLGQPLEIQRALRPLKRKVPSRQDLVLDEDATAAQIADRIHARPWVPVFRPTQEPWLSLAIVLDTGPAMSIWQPLAEELREAMFRLGAFRDVRAWHAAETVGRLGIRTGSRSPIVSPSALIDPTLRQAVLLISDCSGPHWWDGRMTSAMLPWARRGPTAILQPLPERLWRRTAAPTIPGQAILTRPGAPNTELRFAPHDGPIRPSHGAVPVPVVELTAEWLADWAKLVAGSGGWRDTAITYLSSSTHTAGQRPASELELSVRDRVGRFYATASPTAAELAGHVAVTAPSLPVMQLIQRRILRSSRPSDLAELMLSGLLTPLDPARGHYDFVPGAREALLERPPRQQSLATADTLERISAEIAERAGTGSRRFLAMMRRTAGPGAFPADADQQPFALVSPAALGIITLAAPAAVANAPAVSGDRIVEDVRPPRPEFVARRESVERTMVVRQRGDRTQIAVLEDDVLVEHYVNRTSHQSYVGNVYLGKVQNVLPSMEAAFIDFGKGRNGVLYAGEVNSDASALEGRPRPIESALTPGQSVIVQVTKDPVGHKGARLTSQVSLPGRYLVYVPGASMTGISRKLPEQERTRLRSILRKVTPEDAGVIVRTVAEGAAEAELVRDMTRLVAQWESIEQEAKTARPPALLYGEPDLLIRVIRDIFNEDFSTLIVSGAESWQVVEEYVRDVAPHLAGRLSRWDPGAEAGTRSARPGEDVFAAYGIDGQIARALERRVGLPSGGSLVIDRTEAMTVIDVSPGSVTGQGGNLEDTVTRSNLEAAEEIVRQLRLHDVSGIVIIDFIDMALDSNRELVLRRLTECLARDRTRNQVAEVTSLGLVQMTRKRIGSGLAEALADGNSGDQEDGDSGKGRVWLPSGGALIIDRTETMTVIDVNTGRFTGQGGNLEDTVTRSNLEAAEEIVRQLGLHDVSGIVIIDFIDMALDSNRELVLRRLTECLASDPAEHQVSEVTSLGLVQLTRTRIGSGPSEAR